MQKKTLFLTGIGRSGTTLLQQMLHAHSQINFQPETHFFKKYIVPILLGKMFSGKEFLSLVAEDQYLKRLPEKDRTIILGLEPNLENLTSGFDRILQKDNCFFGADKDTEYVRYFPHLKKVYPEAYVINIIRDPREVTLSRKKTPWGAKRSTTFHAAEYVFYYRKMQREGAALFGKRYIVLKFEDLISAPSETLKKLCSDLDLSFENEMLTYGKQSESLIAQDEKAWKGNADKPIMAGNKNKWEKELDKNVVGLLESELKDEMTKMGYTISGAKPNLKTRAEYKLVNAAFTLKTKREKLNG